MTDIYLVRHAEVNLEKGMCYGQYDLEVSPSLDKDAQLISKKLPSKAQIFSSPLKRCASLAKIIFPAQHITHDDRLKELNFGEWEMKKWDEIDKKNLDDWMNDYVNVRCPDGESYADLYKRVIEFVEDQLHNKESVVIITHAGVIRAILSHFLHIPLERSFRIKVDFGSVTKISLTNSIPSIEYINH